MTGAPDERAAARRDLAHRLSARFARAALRAAGPAVESRSVGNALLVHPRGFVDSRALAFVRRLAADPQHTLVVLDLPASPEDSVWESVARVLDRRGVSFRLVPGRGTREDVRRAAQWLADRLDRIVLAPDGTVVPAAGGALFVPADHGTGWLRFRPGLSAAPDSRRFPKPQWEYSVPDRPQQLGVGAVAEPLPGGVWIRGGPDDGVLARDRQRLIDLLVADPELLGIVLGGPGSSGVLELEEIAAFWATVPGSARHLVRFVPYGPVAVPGGESLGQALADRLGHRVIVQAGLPAPGEDGVSREVRTLRGDGSLGWRPYADGFGYAPRAESGGDPAPPVALGTRAPAGAVAEVAPGVYRYAPDVLLEVVPSGLWVRPPAEPFGGYAVRTAPADPAYPAILYEQDDPAVADRMRTVAYELVNALDPTFATSGRVLPSSAARTIPPDGGTPPATYPAARVTPAPAVGAAGPVPAIAPGPGAGQPNGGSANGGPPVQPGPAGQSGPADWSLEGGPSTAAAQPASGSLPASTRTDAEDSGSWDPQRPAPLAPPWPGADPSASVSPARPVIETPPAADPPPTASPQASVDFGPPPAASLPRGAGPVGGGVEGAPVPSAPHGGVWAADRPPASSQASVGFGPPPAAQFPRGAGPVGGGVEGAPVLSAPHGGVWAADRPPASSQASVDLGPPPAASLPARPVGGGAGGAPVPSAPHDVTTPPGGAASGPAPAGTSAVPHNDPAAAASVGTPASAPRIRLESPAPHRSAAEPAPAGGPVAAGDTSAAPPEAGPAAPAAQPPGFPTSPGFATPPESAAAPAPPGDGQVRVQPEPGPAADVLPPAKGVERERDWLRRNLGARYDTAAALVSRVLSEAPGLHGGPRSSVGDALTDLAAVRLYLTGSTSAIDTAIRSAATGPHVPLARCAAGGLRRLPSHRGGAIARAALTPAEHAWYREGSVVVERSFLAALSSVRPGLPGDTDIVLWSLTARRTALVVPELPDRLLFAPGTRFKVLRTVGGDRPAVLMREMAAAELDERGQPREERVPLDEIALTGLDQLHARWQKAEDGTEEDAMGEPLPPEHADAFRAAPGLLQRPPGDPGAPTPALDPGTTPQQGPGSTPQQRGNP
ncbi:hypothetical protein VSR01_09700 [Actinacidiphila sp. DG2A-62]|uniref:hypothetical protein n=1 Tax=Actinacidiphila sp. DG2A-62 TaxID=3108821 RepID=UPI002DB6D266|nr:hypothetical protein [Actinacidiphila sp. DG2A-62]MEC3993799.1 hypothetical protein [Actinacidiphila sp. DG2A-62]